MVLTSTDQFGITMANITIILTMTSNISLDNPDNADIEVPTLF